MTKEALSSGSAARARMPSLMTVGTTKSESRLRREMV
jgi:hypothetical protein